MMRRCVLLPAMLLLSACKDPVTRYREAARQLTFTLDRVEPGLDLVFPLDRSRLLLDLRLGVRNPSQVRFTARRISGTLFLETGGRTLTLGRLDLPRGLDVAPEGTSPLPLELAFTYGELREAWPVLSEVLRSGKACTWRLEGLMHLDALGIPITLPFRSQRQTQ